MALDFCSLFFFVLFQFGDEFAHLLNVLTDRCAFDVLGSSGPVHLQFLRRRSFLSFLSGFLLTFLGEVHLKAVGLLYWLVGFAFVLQEGAALVLVFLLKDLELSLGNKTYLT